MRDLTNKARFTTSRGARARPLPASRLQLRTKTVCEETMVCAWMPHLTGFVIGAVAFVAAHALEASHWSDWFNGEYEPWFLNSGRAVLFTLGLLWMASALTAALATSPRPVRGLAMCGGAFVAKAGVLFHGPSPGPPFPVPLG